MKYATMKIIFQCVLDLFITEWLLITVFKGGESDVTNKI